MTSQIEAQSYFVAIEESIRPGDRIIVVNNVVVAVQHDESNRPRIEHAKNTYANGEDITGNPHWGARQYAYGTPESLPLRLDLLRAIRDKPGWLIATHLNGLNLDPKSTQRLAARSITAQMKAQGLITHHREDTGRSRQRLLITKKGLELLVELSK